MKPSIPKGTRDFSPSEMAKRNYIFDTIRSAFHLFGFQAIETPAMENLTTLEGKYGDEGDKLLFRILNSGSVVEDIKTKNGDIKKSDITEKGLRYDLTVPFARYVVMHQNEISFPFKRYQIQPVWRADRPQKGRYREFYQCDADVIGSASLLNEVELIQLINTVFQKLNLKVTIKINNRKILSGLAEVIGESEKIVDITVALDKLDKVGEEGVIKELNEKGISVSAIEKLRPLVAFIGSRNEKLIFLKSLLASSAIGIKGIEEVEKIISLLAATSELKNELELDITLARGLNYYTGSILEVKSRDVSIGSICGGGRYDDLTGIFGLPNVSGVGISFGADRIYDVLEELKLFPASGTENLKVMFVNFGGADEEYSLHTLSQLRESGINSILYPDASKIKKQFDFANKNNIPFVIVIGEDERMSGSLTLKAMSSGEQQKMDIASIIKLVKTL